MKDDDMTPQEAAYLQGKSFAVAQIIRECVRLTNDAGKSPDAWRIERTETVAKLREICGEHGDNDWPDDLYLVDVLDKHLATYLPEKE